MFNTLQKTDKVGVFIDLKYLLSISRSLDAKIDFNRLRKLITDKAAESHFFVYCSKLPDDYQDSIRKVADYLVHHGFTVSFKQIGVVEKDHGTEYIGNIDVMLAVDLLFQFFTKDLDTVIIFNNKHDLKYPLAHIQEEGGNIILCGIQAPAKKFNRTDTHLINMANEYIKFEDLLEEVYLESHKTEAITASK
jgi:uncharacterized LabA/DUF88 family protein